MAITSLPTQWFLWISGRFITTKTHGKTPTPLIQVCAKMTATTKIMSHSVIHVNKDESLRNINRSNYVLQLGHSFYFCWQKCFKIYYLQKNVTFLDIKCKFKNNTYKGLSYFLESFSIFVSLGVFQNGFSIKILENATATCPLA